MPVIDAQRSKLLEAMAALGVGWVFAMMSFLLVLPYVAAYLHLDIGDADRALVSNTVSAINNAFVWVLGFLYGQSVGGRQKDQTISTLTSTAATIANTASTSGNGATPDKTVELQPGETAAVQAQPAKPADV